MYNINYRKSMYYKIAYLVAHHREHSTQSLRVHCQWQVRHRVDNGTLCRHP